MKWKIIVSKGDEVKEGIIEIKSNAQAVGRIIESHGWKIQYLAPVDNMLDGDSKYIELGGVK